MSAPGLRLVRIFLSLIVGLGAVIAFPASAQQPVDTQPILTEGVTVVAPSLARPRGFLVAPDGLLFVALAGNGGPNRGSGLLPDSPMSGGLTSSVTMVDGGCETIIATALPSVASAVDRVWGVADLAVIGDQLYALVAGGGPAYGNRDMPNGIYQIGSDSSATLIADLSEWQRANPVAAPPKLDRVPDGMPVSMAPIDRELWVSERHHGQILRVGIDGSISRIVDLSQSGLMPAGIVPSPFGGAYVALVGAPPYPTGSAKIVSVAQDGSISDVWTGLTAAIDVAVGADGLLYALEEGVPQSVVPPYLAPQSGRIVRQLGPEDSELVATDLSSPAALEIGSDGGLYVSISGSAQQSQDGTIIRIDPTLEEPASIPPGPWPSPSCIEEEPSEDVFVEEEPFADVSE